MTKKMRSRGTGQPWTPGELEKKNGRENGRGERSVCEIAQVEEQGVFLQKRVINIPKLFLRGVKGSNHKALSGIVKSVKWYFGREV